MQLSSVQIQSPFCIFTSYIFTLAAIKMIFYSYPAQKYLKTRYGVPPSPFIPPHPASLPPPGGNSKRRISFLWFFSGSNIYVCPASNYQQPAKPLRRAGSINAKIYSADARLELHSDDDEHDVNPASQPGVMCYVCQSIKSLYIEHTGARLPSSLQGSKAPRRWRRRWSRWGLRYISLFSGCWNIDDNLFGQLTR